MKLAVLGLSITSSWGNGHATTYRGLLREMAQRGHDVVFFERDAPWYSANRDLPEPPYCRTILYTSLDHLFAEHGKEIREADCVIVGSYVPEGIEAGHWITRHAKGLTAFYDIDTPVTLAKLERDDCDYLDLELIPRYRLYLSFTGGPTLRFIEEHYGSPGARPLYCSVDPSVHRPSGETHSWDLGYLGTYSSDRQPTLDRLLNEPAATWKEGRFIVAGPQYPGTIRWPDNVKRVEHLAPVHHGEFYTGQRYTLNVTRKQMVKAGFSPSVRLFEAAACAVPVISDRWEGIDTFFNPGEEILLASDSGEVLRILQGLPENERREIGERARRRVLLSHTAAKRAEELETYITEAMGAA
ncbi:glycosyltransferase [Geobacter sp. DSM 9736]|uniref:CgeB family protein n=1 Tax=Geobacter sp. DSM 9736 TaxID=1277350 RepID=UPI000B501227|nr:glycosyltransferase [Geobacter sp. DSM 9736]SNB47491.1 Spore maturation protein CgeB [Geobacter sp. DSM 9736]